MISVIVPVYNVSGFLPACMESIISQTYKDIEIILVDDGSTDDSGSICNEYAAKDCRIQVIHQKNAGLPAARNSGIRAASGEWLIFVDSDDYYTETGFFMRLNDTINCNPADIVTFGAVRVQENKKTNIYEGLDAINHISAPERAKWLIENDKFSVSAWMHAIRRDYVLENDFLFDETFKTGEDIEWMLRILARQPIIAGDGQCAYAYRIRKNSICTQERKTKFWIYRYNAIIKSIESINQCCADADYKDSFLSYVAYLYYVLICEIAEEPMAKEKEAITKKCEELLWLRNYAVGKKTKTAKLVVDIAGIPLGGTIMQMRMRRRRKI